MTQIECYLVPETLEEAARAVSGGDATILGGGTILMPQTLLGEWSYGRTLVNLARVAGIASVSVADGRLRVGAMTRIREIVEDPLIARHAPILAEVGRRFANTQVRNIATVGGNLCTGSPSGDMIVPLLLLDAEVELVAWRDGALARRALPLADFFTGPEATVRRADEVLAEITFALPPEGFVAGFEKSGTRRALDVTIASAGLAGIREDGALREPRAVFGGVAPTPMRGRETEAVLAGASLDADTVARAAEAAQAEIRPVTDSRATAWYRRRLVATFTARILRDVA